MRILVVGGGTGGHVMPIRHVLAALNAQADDLYIVGGGKVNDRFSNMLAEYDGIDEMVYVNAGKWRRYPNESKLMRALDVKTHLLNAWDVVNLARGYSQALKALKRIKVDVVFVNGGHVSVPYAKAAHKLGLPIVSHESDTLAGRANNLIAKWATYIGVGAPLANYDYDASKMVYVGIPISPGLAPVDDAEKESLKAKLKLQKDLPVLLVVGGSLGAAKINQAMIDLAPRLGGQMTVVHVAGQAHKSEVSKAIADSGTDLNHYHVLGFTDQMTEFLQVCDVVISRAGATATAELAVFDMAKIIIPASQLADQMKNSKVLAKEGMKVIYETDLTSEVLKAAIQDGLSSGGSSQANSIHASAAKNMALLILKAAQRG